MKISRKASKAERAASASALQQQQVVGDSERGPL